MECRRNAHRGGPVEYGETPESPALHPGNLAEGQNASDDLQRKQ